MCVDAFTFNVMHWIPACIRVTLRRSLYASYVTTFPLVNCSSRVGGLVVKLNRKEVRAWPRSTVPTIASTQPVLENTVTMRLLRISTSNDSDLWPLPWARTKALLLPPSTGLLAVKWAAQQSCNTYRVCTARNGTRLNGSKWRQERSLGVQDIWLFSLAWSTSEFTASEEDKFISVLV